MSSSNAQSGRAAAKARRQAQVQGKDAVSSVSRPAASAPSKSSRVSRPAPTAAPVASSAGREAAKLKRQQQKKGKTGSAAASTSPQPTANIKHKPEAPIVEPRQAKAEQPAKRNDRRTAVKSNDTVVQPAGRLQSKAYRKAQARGKAGQDAFKSKHGSQSGAKAKLANPDASTRDIAKQVRAERCSRGKTCATGGSRPTRQPKSEGSAPQKVGESKTYQGQTVSGTHVGQGKKKMTGAETGACQLVSGTEYLGSEEFSTHCGTTPKAGPAKVTQTQTQRGQSISGTGVGRAERMTGDETGTCSSVTGTEYLPADQSQMYCGAMTPKAASKGFSVMSQPSANKGEKVTGGDNRRSQSTTIKPKNPGQMPKKVMPSQTAMGNTTTGTQVGRMESVTGGEKGACSSVTGTGYQGMEEVKSCGTAPVKGATKVTASGTKGGQKVTGDRSGAYYGMTGAEAGDCQTITGTAYTGSEQAQFCSPEQQNSMKQRQRRGANPSISGVQPGPQGLTGAQKGACQLVTGAHYHGGDQTSMVCNSSNVATPGESDFPVMMGQAQPAPAVSTDVSAEQGSRITGDGWDRGSKVTGTDGPWAAQRNSSIRGVAGNAPMAANQYKPNNSEVPMSPITGYSGNSAAGAKVTLSGGARA